MRLLSLAAGFVFALTAAFPAFAYDTPKTLIEAVYAPYLKDEIPTEEDDIAQRSKALQGLFDADYANTPDGEMGAIDFDPVVDGQDFKITELKIAEPALDGDKGTVDVTFKNFDADQHLQFVLLKEDDGWHYDDIVSLTPGSEYRLTEIFVAE
jgi:hypothetical protein